MTRSEHDSGERRRGRRLFLFLLLVFSLFAHGYIDNPDAEVEFQTARALWRRGSPALSAAFPDASAAEKAIVTFPRSGLPPGFDVMRGVDGHFYSWFGIGHAAVMVPFYAVGGGLARVFPGVEARALETKIADLPGLGRAFGEEFWAHLVVSFHSPLLAAGIGWLLFLILGHFGFRGSCRVLAVLFATLATQLAPGSRESMSDVTATFGLLACLERALAWQRQGGDGKALAAGAFGGFTVLVRPHHVIPLAVLAVWVVCLGRKRGWRGVLGFALAAAPFGAFQLWFNHARFGQVLEFGYSAGTSQGYWDFPWLLGVLFLALSPGKGALLFSPLLWLAPRGLALAWRGHRGEIMVIAAFLLAPWLVSAKMTGWHSSQAWACRYMTPGVALTVCVGTASLLAAGRWRRAVWGLAGLGLVISLGGWLAPYRGFYDLQSRAWDVRWPVAQRAPGEDVFQRAVLTPRMSPLFGHWLYALASLSGRIPGNGQPDPGCYRLLFGVAVEAAPDPQHGEDAGFRHLWPIGLSWRCRSAFPFVLGVIVLLLTGVAGAWLLRSCREPGPPS